MRYDRILRLQNLRKQNPNKQTRRAARNIALYADQPSRTDLGPCSHFEMRFFGAKACRRAGVEDQHHQPSGGCPCSCRCRCADGSRRLAHDRKAETACQPHHHLFAIAPARVEPGGKRLAVPTPELAVQPGLPNLLRHSRCRMSGLEQTRRPTRHNHFNRHEKMGLHRLKVSAAGINHFQSHRATKGGIKSLRSSRSRIERG